MGTYYDSGLLPLQSGSGGGSGARSAGGAGGGVVRIAAGGTLTVDGTISAEGLAGGDVASGGCGGGGAGGTIRLKADVFAGGGLLRARGGRGGDRLGGTFNNGAGGGGAGGRISVRVHSLAFTNLSGATVAGGRGGTGAASLDGVAGGLGTIALFWLEPGADTTVDASTADDRSIEVYRGWRWEPALDGPFVYDSVLITPATRVVAGGGDVTVEAQTITVEDAFWDTTLESSGGCGGSCASVGHVVLSATSVLLEGSQLTTGTARDWTFVVSGSLLQTGGSTFGRIVSWAGQDFAFDGGALVDAQQIHGDLANVDVRASAIWSTDGRGFGGGPGAGATNTSWSGGGGSYGGRGGNGYSAGVGSFYGSGLLPVDLGSGGGAGARSAGGAGGGRIRVAASQSITVGGTLTSSGAQGGDASSGGCGGGGSGGTIRLESDTIAGAGLLRADGGRGGDRLAGSFNNGAGGGGSGGRVAVRTKNLAFTALATARVEGGRAGGGAGTLDGVAGGRGTMALIWLDSGADTTEDTSKADDRRLEIYRGWRWNAAVDGPFTYDEVLVRPGAIVVGGAGHATVTAQSITVDSATWNTTVESTAGCGGSCPTTGSVLLVGAEIVLDHATVTTGTAADWTVQAAGTFAQHGGSTFGRNLSFEGAGDYLFDAGALVDGRVVLVNADDLDVAAGATLRADGRGFGAASGPGVGGTNTSWSGGGASHGGRGSNGYSAGVGTFYGSGLQPLTLGSGGGNGARSSGGAGGGTIRVAMAGTLTLAGTLSADGLQGGDASSGGTGGGGAGGSIRVEAQALAGGGLIRAAGGRGGDRLGGTFNNGGGGGGAGGRVSVRYVQSTFTNFAGMSVAGGRRGTGAASLDGVNGGRGTIAVLTLAPGADTFDDGSTADDETLSIYQGFRFEESVDGPYVYESLTVNPGAIVVAGGGSPTLRPDTLVVDQATWNITVESSEGCAGACPNTEDARIEARVTTLSGATLEGGSVASWRFVQSERFEQTDGVTRGDLVRFEGDAAFDLLGTATVEVRRAEAVARDLTVAAGATIRATGLGFSPARAGRRSRPAYLLVGGRWRTRRCWRQRLQFGWRRRC
ncbi:MAG: hypothetical protein R3F39_14910 [Myxococcota bacterium]